MRPDEPQATPPALSWKGVVALALATLVLLSVWCGQIRIFQVDEVQWGFQARVLGMHAWDRVATNAPLWLLGPLSWWARRAVHSSEVLLGMRLVFTGVFWLNLLLLVKVAGFRLRSLAGCLVLLAAATLEPLWDYGFEIRHDNLLLTGILLSWLFLVPGSARRRWGYLPVGFLAALMQLCAFKSFMYWVPIAGFALVWPHPDWNRSRGRLFLSWAAGLGLMAILGVGIHLWLGTWKLYWSDVWDLFHSSIHVDRFSPWVAFERLFTQTPVLLGAVAAFGAWVTSRGKAFKDWCASWRQGAPEAFFLLLATAVLVANPTPFPYNLVLWVPFAFLASVQLIKSLLESEQGNRTIWLVLLCSAQVAPWLIQTPRHWDHPNDRQLEVTQAAEQLTGPQDAVFDGAGLVSTRPPLAFNWLLHTLTMPHFLDGTYPPIRLSLEQRCVPVILPNYRISWLTDADKAFILSHYVPLAQDCWVLGGWTPKGGGAWSCLHPGRYFLRTDAPSSGGQLTLDGQEVGEAPVWLTAGPHEAQGPAESRVEIFWAGPNLEQPLRLGESKDGPLFQNWY